MPNKISDVVLDKQDILESTIPLIAKKEHRLFKSIGITVISLSELIGLGILGRKRRPF